MADPADKKDEKHVVLTNNKIDSMELQGSYQKWQFKKGPMVDPAQQVTKPHSYSTDKLTCYTNEKKDEYEYQGEIELSYDAGEDLVMTGPNEGEITLSGKGGKGQQSDKMSRWKKGGGEKSV